MHSTSDFKKGLKLLIDGDPYTITDFQHVKPGKGNQFTRTKLRNLLTGSNLERTFKSGEKFGVPDVMFKDMNYLYQDDTGYTFMDMESYDQVTISEKEVADTKDFLTENLKVQVMFFNERACGIEPPKSVQLKVAQTDPGLKGNTATGAVKPATLETGLVVSVPLHIKEGDLLKVDTSTGAYVERVNQ